MGLEALEGMVNTARAAPTNMSNAEMQMVHDGLKRHFRAMDLGLQWKAEEDRCGLPPYGLLQARPCRLPHCARPRVRGPRDS